jgi:hypothetical protein
MPCRPMTGFSSSHTSIWNNLPVTPTALPTVGSWYLVACVAGPCRFPFS